MKHGFLSCFLCVSLILLTSGLSTAGDKEANRPLGDMTSRGEVKFEAREGAWKNVEPSYFPVFQGMKIKTEKGAAVISLAKRSTTPSFLLNKETWCASARGRSNSAFLPRRLWPLRWGVWSF
jgi:hypothetical protein